MNVDKTNEDEQHLVIGPLKEENAENNLLKDDSELITKDMLLQAIKAE